MMASKAHSGLMRLSRVVHTVYIYIFDKNAVCTAGFSPIAVKCMVMVLSSPIDRVMDFGSLSAEPCFVC